MAIPAANTIHIKANSVNQILTTHFFNGNSLAVKRVVEQVTVEQEEAGFCFNRFLDFARNDGEARDGDRFFPSVPFGSPDYGIRGQAGKGE